jgi:hypothetical protein
LRENINIISTVHTPTPFMDVNFLIISSLEILDQSSS